MAYEKIIGTDIAHAAALLSNGEVIGIPTETVYGLAANATDPAAVEKIFRIKNRPLSNPLIVHVASFEQVRHFTREVPELAAALMEAFSPGPLTLLLPRNERIPGIVTAGLPDVAIRIPDHPLTLSLLRQSGLPLAAPSANPFGYISPTTAAHVAKMLGGQIPYILDGGQCKMGIESTIVGFPGGVPTLYREGVITREELEHKTGPVKTYHGRTRSAPGMLPAHYQPATPLLLCDDIDTCVSEYQHLNIGLITHGNYSAAITRDRQILLCEPDDYMSASHNLYAAMHSMDERGYDRIIVKKFPDHGIGHALNDRLTRASKK